MREESQGQKTGQLSIQTAFGFSLWLGPSPEIPGGRPEANREKRQTRDQIIAA
jgi:hypothetical protein